MPGEVKLKPCPFCGDEAHVSKIDFHFDPNQHEYRVNCLNYRCLGRASHTNHFKTEEEAISGWNRRTPEPCTSVIRWTRYDGTPETLPEFGEDVLFHDEETHFVNHREMREYFARVDVGDLWAYLPEPPEGME